MTDPTSPLVAACLREVAEALLDNNKGSIEFRLPLIAAALKARATSLDRASPPAGEGATGYLRDWCCFYGPVHAPCKVQCDDCAKRQGRDRPSSIEAGGVGGGEAGRTIADFVREQRAWSEETFGPGPRAKGNVDHIRKELLEIEANPSDLVEWLDVATLALDGAWREGYSPEVIASGLFAKLAKNKTRQWPDWRTQDPEKGIQHIEALQDGAPPPSPSLSAETPVAYRYLYPIGDGTYVWRFDPGPVNGTEPVETQPLYTTPRAPSPVQEKREGVRCPAGSNADEWAAFIAEHAHAPEFLAVQIADLIDKLSAPAVQPEVGKMIERWEATKRDPNLLGCMTEAGDALAKALGEMSGHVKAHKAAHLETQAEVDRLSKLIYVPGLWRCAKCNCQTISTNIHAATGGFSANNEPQQCPNNCGPMWRVTERDAGNRLIDDMDKLIADREIMREELAATKARAETAEQRAERAEGAAAAARTYITQPLRMRSSDPEFDGKPTATYDTRPYNELVSRLASLSTAGQQGG